MINTLAIQFNTPISFQEIPFLRGAVIKAGANEDNLFLHNHEDEGKLRYSYPLVQYKRIGGKAFILCLEDGVNQMIGVLPHLTPNTYLGRRKVSLIDCQIYQSYEDIFFLEEPIRYCIQDWIPLNDENYRKYICTPSLVDRIEMLQKILTGNILAFAKGIDVCCENPIEVVITELDKPCVRRSKGVDLLCFNVDFLCNVNLPQYIGLGKGVSKGHGVVNRIINRNK